MATDATNSDYPKKRQTSPSSSAVPSAHPDDCSLEQPKLFEKGRLDAPTQKLLTEEYEAKMKLLKNE